MTIAEKKIASTDISSIKNNINLKKVEIDTDIRKIRE